MEEEEAGQDELLLEQLQSEVNELRGQLDELESEKEVLMKRATSLEDRQVNNWKWIQDATKFSGSITITTTTMKYINHLFVLYRNIGEYLQ